MYIKLASARKVTKDTYGLVMINTKQEHHHMFVKPTMNPLHNHGAYVVRLKLVQNFKTGLPEYIHL